MNTNSIAFKIKYSLDGHDIPIKIQCSWANTRQTKGETHLVCRKVGAVRLLGVGEASLACWHFLQSANLALRKRDFVGLCYIHPSENLWLDIL